MSTNDQIDPKQPVLMGDLKELMDQFNDAFKKRDEQNEARFNQFAQVLQQVVDKVQEKQQAGGPLATVDKGAIVDKVVDRLLAKVSGEETDPQFNEDFQRYKLNINKLQGLAIQRANKAIDLLLQKELKGLSSTVSTNIASRQLAEDLTHGPA